MKPTPREAKVIHEHYEKVVEHLLAEGYAEDKEAADKIIEGMSAAWYSLIVDWGRSGNCPQTLPETPTHAMITR